MHRESSARTRTMSVLLEIMVVENKHGHIRVESNMMKKLTDW